MKELVFIGNYSTSIKICEFENGNLKIINEIKDIESPSYLSINNGVLYAVSEKEIGKILTYNIKDLKKINYKIINQSLPCYLSTDKNHKKLAVSNYGSGSIYLYEINQNGEIGNEIKRQKYSNANMHFSKFIEDEIYGIDLANDMIHIYNNQLDEKSIIQTPKNSGPRHAVIIKNLLFVVTEISNQILVYERKKDDYKLIQEISTIKDKKVKTYAGAIKISKNNKNIYVTNRGENTISVYSLIKNKLELIQNIHCYGDFPRDITLNKTEEYALVANQKSDNISIFKRNIENGKLTKISELKTENPACIVEE